MLPAPVVDFLQERLQWTQDDHQRCAKLMGNVGEELDLVLLHCQQVMQALAHDEDDQAGQQDDRCQDQGDEPRLLPEHGNDPEVGPGRRGIDVAVVRAGPDLEGVQPV